jgi:hypothetical protein
MTNLGSWKQEVNGTSFTPYSFRGHGWLYSHTPETPEEEQKLIDAGAFKIEGQKKNGGTIVFKSRREPAATAKRSKKCCGRR